MLKGGVVLQIFSFLASTRSSRKANVRPFVYCSVQVCLELSNSHKSLSCCSHTVILSEQKYFVLLKK